MTRAVAAPLAPTLVLALAALAVAPAPAGQEQPTFPSGITLVKVDVVVVDRDGRPVRSLRRESFRVLDEGRERPVASFEEIAAPPPAAGGEMPTRPPRVSTNVGEGVRPPRPYFVFVYEGLRTSAQGALRATRVIRQFAEANPGLDADVTLATTHRDEAWTGTLKDLGSPAAVERALQSVLGPRIVSGQGLDPRGFDAGTAYRTPSWATRDMNRMTEDARSQRLGDLIRRLPAGRPGRTTMIVLGEGVIVDPLQRRTKDLVGPAAQNRVVVYGLDLRGVQAPATGVDGATLEGDGADGTVPRTVLDDASSWAEELALATGGRNFRSTERLDAALACVVEESLSHYVLGFEPDPGARPGRLRSIEVKLADRGYEVRARPSYVVPRPGDDPRGGAPSRPPLPLRVAAFVQGPAGEGRSRVRLVLEVDPAALSPGTGGRVTLESQVDAVPLDGGQVQRLENRSDVRLTPELRQSMAEAWVPLARDVDLGPGRYEARVVLRDAGSGRSGELAHPFEVPAPGALRITTPVLTDLFRPDGSPREIARTRFERARQVECAFEVLGAAPAEGGQPRLDAHWSLRTEGGQVLGGGSLSATGGEGTRFAFTLRLAPLDDGAYVLGATVRDLASGATAEDEVPFEVAGGAGSPPG